MVRAWVDDDGGCWYDGSNERHSFVDLVRRSVTDAVAISIDVDIFQSLMLVADSDLFRVGSDTTAMVDVAVVD